MSKQKAGLISPAFCFMYSSSYMLLSIKLSALPAALKKKDRMKRMIKTTKRIFAIPAEADAMPVKPSTPAMRARTKKVKAQDNIRVFIN